MPYYAILIDGGFVKRKLGSQASPMTALALNKLVEKIRGNPLLAAHALHRIYFYDATPLDIDHYRPLQGGVEKFRSTKSALLNRQLHNDLAKIDYFSLRMGKLNFRGWKISPKLLNENTSQISVTAQDLKPDIVQKGVDMRIGLDIAALTLKQKVKIIVLVTGDSDFVPAMKFARREEAQLILVPLGHAIKSSMYEHADIVLSITP